jgi:SCP-2 sterol transfer family
VRTDMASRSADGDTVSRFFGELAEAGHLATFERQSVQDGDVSVTRENKPADGTVRMERQHFAAMVTGRLNAMAAILRGLLTLEGNMAAAMTFQRCLPGPPGSTGHVAPIDGETVMTSHAGGRHE